MSGKRLLDSLALLKASSAVVSKHIALRRQQVNVYERTSSIARVFKNQTEWDSSIVKGIPGNAFTREISQTDVDANITPLENKSGLDKDRNYEKPETNTNAQLFPVGELIVQREKGKSQFLRDGALPPIKPIKNGSGVHYRTSSDLSRPGLGQGASISNDEGIKKALQLASPVRDVIPVPGIQSALLNPDGGRDLQKHTEKDIPSNFAEVQPVSSQVLQDVFYTSTQKTSQVSSSIPSVKLPMSTEDTTEVNGPFSSNLLNQDVSYSSVIKKTNETPIPEGQAVPEQQQPSDEIFSDMLHGPRVAKMLKGESKRALAVEDSSLHVGQGPLLKHRELPQGRDQEKIKIRSSGQNLSRNIGDPGLVDMLGTLQKADTKEVRNLAEDLEKESRSVSSATRGISDGTEKRTLRVPYKMHESTVPSSRLSRLWQYGGLATSMAFGAVNERLRRAAGRSDVASGPLMLSAGNMERLVAKLSKMRGAALKLGQMMSFQDSKMLPPAMTEVLQRVQDSADYMPASQRNKVLESNLGSDWRVHFSSFDEVPMAAASIGQVHGAVLQSTGKRVAVKVQYPGVADSINSDLNNLSILLTASRLLPKGLYLEKTIANARMELAWECDYIREAECAKKFKSLLHDEQDIFVVPSIISEASGPQVLTMEMMEGIGVTKIKEFTQEEKNWIGTQILRLCLREIIEFKFMQTDPNWTNFLFNSKTNKLELLDFGACRDFPEEFIDPYIRVIHAASRNDRESCRALSIQLRYLTGHESQAMLNAHIASILTLAEPFAENSPDIYDFRNQTITERIREFIPVMVKERLAPPPEETYSLHRKLSGAFLLCARLGSRVRCRELFANAIQKAGIA